MEIILIILSLLVTAFLLVLFFSMILSVVVVLVLLSSAIFGVGFFYESLIDGRILIVLWFLPILLCLIVTVTIVFGRLTVIPFKFYKFKKPSFKLRGINIIFLFCITSLALAVFIYKNLLTITEPSFSLFI
jgi:hypothetical protein